nr:uncharacterized protein LOC113816359 [Penaeus vannamei]
MNFLIPFVMTVVVAAAPQGNYLPKYAVNGLSHGLSPDSGGGTLLSVGCEEGEIIHSDGTCVIRKNLYLFEAPEQPYQPIGPPPALPRPKLNQNHIYVRVPEEPPTPEPVVLPPPRRKTLVYILRKVDERVQRVIEFDSIPSPSPQVYFINYQDGENPSLPIGIHMDNALGVISDTVVGNSGRIQGDSVGLAGGIRMSTAGRSTSVTFSNHKVLIPGAGNRRSRSSRGKRGFISRSLTPSSSNFRT